LRSREKKTHSGSYWERGGAAHLLPATMRSLVWVPFRTSMNSKTMRSGRTMFDRSASFGI
jgi:hypothetical protein